MRQLIYISISCAIFICSTFIDGVQARLSKTILKEVPFQCTKTTIFPIPHACIMDASMKKIAYTYSDLGLTQKYKDPNTNCEYLGKFKHGDFDIVIVDFWISEYGRQMLVTYHGEEFVDAIETSAVFYIGGIVYAKQWQIDKDKNIIVTWLKVDSPTPIGYDSKFQELKAQRIDTYYQVDDNGKFQQTKEIKYKPRIYQKTELIDKDKNLWDGDEIPIMEK